MVEHEGQEAVEAALQAALTARFTLTNDTPGMQEPLRSLLGRGDTEVAKQILEGTYECPEDMDEGSKLFIKNLKARWTALKQTVSVVVTAEDFRSYWTKAKEGTSSSMSGIHFGHYKSATKSEYLSKIHAISMHIILNAGFSPSRWQRGLTAMIEKKPGVMLVLVRKP